jgi:hypothetical protein
MNHTGNRPYAGVPTAHLVRLSHILDDDHTVLTEVLGIAKAVHAELSLRDDLEEARRQLRAAADAITSGSVGGGM